MLQLVDSCRAGPRGEGGGVGVGGTRVVVPDEPDSRGPAGELIQVEPPVVVRVERVEQLGGGWEGTQPRAAQRPGRGHIRREPAGRAGGAGVITAQRSWKKAYSLRNFRNSRMWIKPVLSASAELKANMRA